MDTGVKNFKIGLATIIACYLAFIFYILVLFLSIEIFGKDNMVYTYILAGFLVAFVLAAGILFLVSLILNIRQTKAAQKILQRLNPHSYRHSADCVVLLAFAVKALTEGR